MILTAAVIFFTISTFLAACMFAYYLESELHRRKEYGKEGE